MGCDEHGKKIWANLKEEEVGDGFTGEQARQSAQKRVEDGTHHFLTSWTCSIVVRVGLGLATSFAGMVTIVRAIR